MTKGGRRARPLDPELVRSYALRDWGAVRRLHLRQCAARFRAEGPEGSVAVSRRLWRFVHSVRRGRPSARASADDLAHQVELKRLLDRAARAFPIR
ncbi:MAG: hypothetical protein QOD06_216 [Candidatus Binatota bacterium]|nr:hypothetical protein [Candidatus Binatota bacterium]